MQNPCRTFATIFQQSRTPLAPASPSLSAEPALSSLKAKCASDLKSTVGALIVRIGLLFFYFFVFLGGILYYGYDKEPPRQNR